MVAAAAADLVLESEDVARWLERSAFFVAEVEMVRTRIVEIDATF